MVGNSCTCAAGLWILLWTVDLQSCRMVMVGCLGGSEYVQAARCTYNMLQVWLNDRWQVGPGLVMLTHVAVCCAFPAVAAET
jgi:hypothetical protein